METFSVNELAAMTQEAGKAFGIDVKINHLENPRIEAEEHYYNPTYQSLLNLGVKPHLLSAEVMEQMMQIILKYKNNIRTDIIFKGLKW